MQGTRRNSTREFGDVKPVSEDLIVKPSEVKMRYLWGIKRKGLEFREGEVTKIEKLGRNEKFRLGLVLYVYTRLTTLGGEATVMYICENTSFTV